jgi:hypothetical protein
MKYTKISFSILFAVFFAYTAVVTSVFAINTSDNENTSTPATQDNGNTSTPATQDNGNTSTPATQDNGNTSTPATQDNGNTSTPATQDNGNTAGGSETPSTPSSSNNGGGSSSGSRGGGSRGGSGKNSVITTTTPVLTMINTSGCPYINSYMRFGAANDKTDVTKLQAFLKNSEGLNVDLNGTFDQKTLDAVKAFQAKYVEETMAPWGVTTPTGQVFYTTKNKINELVCKTPVKLTAEQLQAINAFKTSLTDSTTNTDASQIGTNISTSTQLGSADAPLKAAVGTSSVFGKVWGFVKWLFGY